jgi:hypothetical protein
MREDGCMMSQCPAHDAEASTSRAALPTSDVAVARPEQGRGHAGARRPISTRPRPSRCCGRSFGATVPRLTMS